MHLLIRPSTPRRARAGLSALLLVALLAALTLGPAPVAHAATLTVTNMSDSGPGSLRQAVLDANANPGADTIRFDPSLSESTITLTSGRLNIESEVTVDGPGADQLTISGNNTQSIFRVFASPISGKFGNLTLKGVTLTGGDLSNFPLATLTIIDSSIVGGNEPFGGIASNGLLIVTNSTFSGNTGAIRNAGGRALVTDSIFSGNMAARGGAIFNSPSLGFGDLRVTGSTFSGNTATESGGAIYSEDNSRVLVTNSTFSANMAPEGGAISNKSIPGRSGGELFLTSSTLSDNTAQSGGGIFTGANDVTTVSSSIVAGNSAPDGPDIGGPGSFIDLGFNLLADDPLLSPLANNGGPTPTLLPKPGSPALDAAGGAPCTTAVDQRGVSRPQGVACDIGAVEVFPNSVPVATDDTYSTAEDTPVSGNVLTNDTDVDNDALTAIKLTDPSHGALSFNADGSFTYTPAANYNGVDSFSYKANDGQADSNEATVNITVTAVNDAPTINVSTGQCLSDSKAQGSLSLVLSDVENDSLSVSATSSNTKLLPSKGIVLGGSGANRSVTISAADKQSGTAVVAVKVSDGTDTTTLNLTVKVGTPQNETLTGTSGVDMLFGMNGRNTLNGLGGNDLLCGGNGDDTLNGGDGNDTLNGGRGNDSLNGDDGDDTLTGDQGADRFSGGAGADAATDFTPSQGDTKDGTLP